MPKLTKTLIENTPLPKKGEIRIVDSELKGFGCRIYPSGKKSFYLMYTIKEGRRRRRLTKTLGASLNVNMARKMAMEFALSVKTGVLQKVLDDN